MFKKKKNEYTVKMAHEPGHFYSPVVNPHDITPRQDQIWPEKPDIKGIDFNEHYHQKVLQEFYPKYISQYNYVESHDQTHSDNEYYTQNSQFSWLDSRTLFVLLNQWQPKKMIEVGSGFSSLLTANVNHTLLNDGIDFTCIEPYPRDFLKKKIPGLNNVVIEKVEDVDKKVFTNLQAGDILFIDSSHVSKTGSDVNFLFFEILPILNKGVKIHIHDIFFPHDYLKEWVIDENRSWNEQYLLRALLMFSDTFKVLFGCSYAQHKYPDLVVKALNHKDKHGFGGGSIWIEKIK
ncbi:MAG: class I SAM-dependent methyltransferase [Marinicellaceae bacterium]